MRIYTLEEGKRLVKVARKTVDGYVSSHKFERSEVDRHAFGFNQKHGLFITIAHYPTFEVRGSMGFIAPSLPISRIVVDAAIAAAAQDPRYVPVSHLEIDHIVVEVCVLGGLEHIGSKNPEEIKKKIGDKDGLYIEYGFNSGILLPTSVGLGWSKDDMLDDLCVRAGLDKHVWRKTGVSLFRFGAQAFREVEPNGEVEEIKLD